MYSEGMELSEFKGFLKDFLKDNGIKYNYDSKCRYKEYKRWCDKNNMSYGFYATQFFEEKYNIKGKKKMSKKMSMSDYAIDCGGFKMYKPENMVVNIPSVGIGGSCNYIGLGTTTVNTLKAPVCAPTTNGNETMYIDTNSPIPNQQKAYLAERASKTYREQQTTLRKTFFMDDDAAPSTSKDLVDRILAGQYTIDKKYEDSYTPLGTGYIEWRDPAKPADKAGYEAATVELKKQYTTVADAIMIKDADAGLAAIQALEAWTSTGKAN